MIKRKKSEFLENRNGEKSDFKNQAHTRLLTRIIVYLKEIKEQVNYTELRKNIPSANSNKLPDALNWLVNNNILLKRKISLGNKSNMYYINPKWRKLKKWEQKINIG